MAYATVSDVTSRWTREPTTEETTLITTRLEDVERLIRRRIPDLDTKVADADYLADVVWVEAESVLRLVRNPDGYVSETDGNYTYMLSQQQATGRLEILPDEWEALGWRRSRMSVLVPNIVPVS